MDSTKLEWKLQLLCVCHDRFGKIDSYLAGESGAIQQLKVLWQWVITNHHINYGPMPDEWICNGIIDVIANEMN